MREEWKDYLELKCNPEFVFVTGACRGIFLYVEAFWFKGLLEVQVG